MKLNSLVKSLQNKDFFNRNYIETIKNTSIIQPNDCLIYFQKFIDYTNKGEIIFTKKVEEINGGIFLEGTIYSLYFDFEKMELISKKQKDSTRAILNYHLNKNGKAKRILYKINKKITF